MTPSGKSKGSVVARQPLPANDRLMQEQQNFFSHVLELLGSMVEAVKPAMQDHAARCVRLACAIGKAMELEEHGYRMLYYASYLHDIGYIGLNNSKMAARLGLPQGSEAHHPLASVKMLEGITVLEGALPIIEQHHEAYDGTGFPGKLKGENISLGARILYLVENLEELRVTSGMEGDALRAHAIRQAKEGAGTRYDPKIVPVAMEILENYKEVW